MSDHYAYCSAKALTQINFEARCRGETQVQVLDRWMRERAFAANVKKLKPQPKDRHAP